MNDLFLCSVYNSSMETKDSKRGPQLKSKDLGVLVERIAALTKGKNAIITPSSKPYAVEMGARLDMSPEQATILSVIIDRCDNWCIRLSEIACHFGLSTMRIVDQIDILDGFVKTGLITRRKDREGNDSYVIKPKVIKDLKQGIVPKAEPVENLQVEKFIDKVFELLELRRTEDIEDGELYESIPELIDKNQHLSIAAQLKDFHFCCEDLVLFLVMSMNFILDKDDRQMSHDIDDYMNGFTCRRCVRELERGTSILMMENLVEYVCDDGKADPTIWKLTDHAKLDVFSELQLQVAVEVPTGLTQYSNIKEKALFFNDSVARQVNRLESLLEPQRMVDILKSMESHGMRKGFSCLFYGTPGTGKTETVLQIARKVGRDIMQVDIPSIRSKWVGDTEKNIKSVFDQYRKAAKENANAPILLFNEADALFTRRSEGSTSSVDKMENAMQNIILQEMENLEGILIATTNLTGSLDDAFERRFLYKIEFEKPQPEQRMHIWKSMLPDLDDADAMTLADKYDFSGGQIENIARKRIVNDILDCREEIDMNSILESCETERISQRKSAGRQIGFN